MDGAGLRVRATLRSKLAVPRYRTAVRASRCGAVGAVRQYGEKAVTAALREGIAPFVGADGRVRWPGGTAISRPLTTAPLAIIVVMRRTRFAPCPKRIVPLNGCNVVKAPEDCSTVEPARWCRQPVPYRWRPSWGWFWQKDPGSRQGTDIGFARGTPCAPRPNPVGKNAGTIH